VSWGGVVVVGEVVWFSYTARPPPPVVLPAAAFALLCLGGAFGAGLRPSGLRCRLLVWGGGDCG